MGLGRRVLARRVLARRVPGRRVLARRVPAAGPGHWWVLGWPRRADRRE